MFLKIILRFFVYIQIIYSNFHTYLFNKLNKKIIIKLKFIPLIQVIISKIFRKLIIKFQISEIKYQNLNLSVRSNVLYKFSKDITIYIIKNNICIDKFIKNLDQLSKITINRAIERILHIYTHSLIDMKKITNPKEIRDENEINKFISSLKNKIKLPIDIYEIPVFYYDCGLKFVPSFIVKRLDNKDFIDCGAGIGDSALIFEKNYRPRNIHAFEPDLRNYKFLLKTIKTNNLKKIVPHRKGIGVNEGIINLVSIGCNSYISKKGNQKIQITTINNYVFQNNLSIGLIKLDIEGFELNALIGAEKVIQKYNPVLLIAIYHNGKEFFETMDYIKKISPNYKFIIRKLNPLTDHPMLIGWTEN